MPKRLIGKLVAARWKGKALELGYRLEHEKTEWRPVRSGTALTMGEAARALGTYDMLLERLERSGQLRLKEGGPGRPRLVPWKELVRLRDKWRGGKPSTVAQ